MNNLPSNYYREELNRSVWDVPQHYLNLNTIGSGAYGQVCSAQDTRINRDVAIKKLSRPFQTVMHAERAYREIRLLNHMKHENVITLLDTFTPQDKLEDFVDVYLVTPLVGTDLNDIMKVQKLSDEQVLFFVYQLLRGLKYIHSAGIIHRDLKPGNVAVNEDCELKILDFGLARATDDSMTGYVATRWYRAPEVILNWMKYNEQVDIWSVGCIMAELLTGRPLFPGDDHIDQLTKIMKLVGKPSDEFFSRITNANARSYIRSMPVYERQDFQQAFPKASAEAQDILSKMLALDPFDRLSAEQCLQHPYLREYHDPDDEPTALPFDESCIPEGSEMNIDTIKELMFKEIKGFVYQPPADDSLF